MKRSIAIPALLGVTVAAVPCGAEIILGSVSTHNGSATSYPAGTGDVDVELFYGGFPGSGPHVAYYYEAAVHELHFSFPGPPATHMYNHSSLSNYTGVAWMGFRILLEGADFGGFDPGLPPAQARADSPVVDVGVPPDWSVMAPDVITHQRRAPWHPEVSSSAITRFNNQGSGFRDAELLLWFDAPLGAGMGLVLWYEIIPSAGVPNPTDFTGYFEPIPIPEPATAVLLVLAGLVTLATHRRSV